MGERFRKTANLGRSRQMVGAMWTFLLSCALIRCWVMPLRSGFFLDETGTYYVISGNWHQFLERMHVAIQSPIYCGMLWLVYHGIGSSELILRAPSILAMGLAAFLLYRLTSHFIYPAAGLPATLIFITMPDVGHLAYLARPYSVLIAVVLASTWYFLRWIDTRHGLDGVVCILFLAAAFYSFPTCALMAIVYGLVVAREDIIERTLPWKQLALGAALLIILCLPIFPYYISAARRASAFSFANTPPLIDFFEFLHGIGCAASVLGVGVLYLIFSNVEWCPPPLSRRVGLLISTWLILPPGILLVIARLTSAKLFVPRYYAYNLPAAALVFATLVCCLKQTRQRVTLVLVIALSLAFSEWRGSPWLSKRVDWRETSNTLRQQHLLKSTPVFIRSGFIEAKSLPWFKDQVRLGFLLAPTHAYPIPGDVVALPYEYSPEFDRYMANAVQGLASQDEFFLVDGANTESWRQWFLLRYGQTFESETLESEHGAQVIRFRRR